MIKFLFATLFSLLLFNFPGKAQVIINNLSSQYTQDFNTLASTGTSSTVPTGWAFLETGTGANTTYAADAGGTSAGNTYSYGVNPSSERAFGTLQSSSVNPMIGVQFANNSGTAITAINITYTGEQWRLGALARQDKLDFQYSIDATSLSTGTWTDENNLDFIAPVTSGTLGGIVGNNAPNKTLITFNITGLNIPSGTGFWLRWTDLNASGSDDGLAIDDLSINFNGNSTPPCSEPTVQATSLILTPSPTTINGSFTAASPAADQYLIVRSSNNTLSSSPVDGVIYNAGQSFGGGTIISIGTSTSFTDNGLSGNSTYYYFVFAFNSEDCVGGPNYLSTNPLTGNTNTLPLPPCTAPSGTASSLSLTPANFTIAGNFTAAAGANRYLVVRSISASLSALPADGVTYASGQTLGNGVIVGYINSTAFIATGLTPATLYYFFIFPASGDCSGEPLYNSSSLNGNSTTTNSVTGIPVGYYNSAAGLECDNLKTALFNIISSNTSVLSYSPGVWDAFSLTDLHRNDNNTADIIWDIYSDNPTGPEVFTYDANSGRCGSYTGEGQCYNKEHSFPQAWFGNGALPMYSDMHHIFPTDGFSNGKHNNYPYSEVGTASYTSVNGSKLGNNTFPGFSGTVFEPINEYKGDIARATLYMVTRYQSNIPAWQLNANANDILDGNTYPSLDPWYIQLLFKWHNQDPVSQKEIDRNNAVYALQGNRNPYIDHPEYVYEVWKCTGVIPVTLIDFTGIQERNSILLKWTATRETNFKKYEVERSTNALNFISIGSVAGQHLTSYDFTDMYLPHAPVIYYRLKMIDVDGRYTYSRIVTVKPANSNSDIVVYPNPANTIVTMKWQQSSSANNSLLITDITGRSVVEQTFAHATGSITLDTKHLPAGRYFVRIKNDNGLINTSFLIIR